MVVKFRDSDTSIGLLKNFTIMGEKVSKSFTVYTKFNCV